MTIREGKSGLCAHCGAADCSLQMLRTHPQKPTHFTSLLRTHPTEWRTKGLSTGRQTFLEGGKGFKTLIIPKIKRKYSSRIEGRRKKGLAVISPADKPPGGHASGIGGNKGAPVQVQSLNNLQTLRPKF